MERNESDLIEVLELREFRNNKVFCFINLESFSKPYLLIKTKQVFKLGGQDVIIKFKKITIKQLYNNQLDYNMFTQIIGPLEDSLAKGTTVLYQILDILKNDWSAPEPYINLIKSKLDQEKSQIVDAFNFNNVGKNNFLKKYGEEYYNKTYRSGWSL